MNCTTVAMVTAIHRYRVGMLTIDLFLRVTSEQGFQCFTGVEIFRLYQVAVVRIVLLMVHHRMTAVR
jgi:hypothetical protein